jgi:hypothetical protein
LSHQHKPNSVFLKNDVLLSLHADGSSAGAAAAVSTPVSSSDAAGLLELNKDSFQAFIDAAGDKLVVVDFFTDVSCIPTHAAVGWWRGPHSDASTASAALCL